MGPFSFERIDLHLDENKKQSIVQNCKDGNYTSFGKYNVERVETTDGFKFFFDDDTWLMIRASGTEPVLRTYSESSSQEKCFDILEETRRTLLD